MSRTVKALSLLCAASLLGNLWLYRELRARKSAEPPRAASVLSEARKPVPELEAVSAPAASAAAVLAKPAVQKGDKCREKFEGELRRQLRDPKEREIMKRQEIVSLQVMNVGAATRLHLSEESLNRILELQAEEDLSQREATIGAPWSPKVVAVNPEIAGEFGEAVASNWAEDQREFSARAAVQGVANLFADANVPLSQEQRHRLVKVYADEIEMQGGPIWSSDMQALESNARNPRALADSFEKQAARQQAFEQRVQAEAVFLTPVQLELLRKKSDLEAEHFRAFIEAMPKTGADFRTPEIEC
jgi:hypothetical protein